MPSPITPHSPKRAETNKNPAQKGCQTDSKSPDKAAALRADQTGAARDRKFGRPEDNRDPNAPPRLPQTLGLKKDAEEGVVHEHVANTENDARTVEEMKNESNAAAPAGKPNPVEKRV